MGRGCKRSAALKLELQSDCVAEIELGNERKVAPVPAPQMGRGCKRSAALKLELQSDCLPKLKFGNERNDIHRWLSSFTLSPLEGRGRGEGLC
jgi:hypothetical protein